MTLSPVSATFAVLTVSDRCSKNESVDVSGPALNNAIKEIKLGQVVWNGLVPDQISDIQNAVKKCCDDLQVNVLLTNGGTGLSERDVTPEAVQPLLDKLIPAFSTKLILDGLKVTPFAILSRGVVGIRKNTIVINLPGSPKGAVEGLEALAAVIPHAVDLVLGRKKAVASVHGEVTAHSGDCKSKVVINTSEISRLRCSKWPMLEMTEIPDIMKNQVHPLSLTNIESLEAAGHILGEDVVAWQSLPRERTSMKDGYVIFNVLPHGPLVYNVVGEYKPGESDIKNAEDCAPIAVKVSTGSCVPENAFCVVPVEDTEPKADGSAIIIKSRSYHSGEDIRPVGSDMQEGDTVLSKNTLIGPAEVGVLASIAQTSVSVYRRPTVAILSTGDELQEAWGPEENGKIRDSNRSMLITLLQQWGYQTVDLHISTDDPDRILKSLRSGFGSADVVISTGGMSMGERDLLKEILQIDLQAKIHFGRLRMKPGKPTGFATLSYNGSVKYWFGLPGNPASAFVMAYLVVLPALRIMSGWKTNLFLRRISAEVQTSLKKDPERVEFLRGVLSTESDDGDLLLVPTVRTTGINVQHSSCIRGCSVANCLIEVPSGQGAIEEGHRVTAHLLL